MKRAIKKLTAATAFAAAVLMTLTAVGQFLVPDCITVSDTTPVICRVFQAGRTTTPVFADASQQTALTDRKQVLPADTRQEDYCLFGVIPVKTVSVTHAERRNVVVCGGIIGLEMFTAGVIVVGTDSFVADTGTVSPAQDAGLAKGDVILTANGQEIADNYSFSLAVENSGGEPMLLEILREGVPLTLSMQPRRSTVNGRYRCGVWVRDSTAGIGTMSFYEPESRVYAALGHAVCDVDTGAMLPVAGGEIMNAAVRGITKGAAGTAGELCGTLESGVLGSLDINCDGGIYGLLTETPLNAGEYPVAWASEVHTGDAQLLLSLDGEHVEEYDIAIRRFNADFTAETKNMIVEITDEALLEQTGGIVQGMSGSPIVQEGRFVGAVTHVFVNDPTGGYAIFAENMLAIADCVVAGSR